MSVAENIRLRREEIGMSQEELAHAVGFSGRSAISKIERGENDVSQAKLRVIARALNTSPAALLDGDGTEQIHICKRLPVLGSIAGGAPITAMQNIDADDYVDIDEAQLRHGDYLALRVKGQSMEPIIYDGAIAIIRLCNDWINGAVMAVYIDGYDATLKKVKIDHNGILMLQPFNSEFETRIFTPDEQRTHNIRPLGVLVEHRQKWTK